MGNLMSVEFFQVVRCHVCGKKLQKSINIDWQKGNLHREELSTVCLFDTELKTCFFFFFTICEVRGSTELHKSL